ncbi:MAG: type II secretion system protein M [Xanthomonadales bacterium]|nr:type II secretion system protein M [Xanthomonadales bacterium]
MTAWWENLQVREKRFLGLAAVAVVAFVYWLGVWRPLTQADSVMSERVARQSEDVAWMRAAAAEAARLGEQPAATGNRGDLSLLALSEQSARGTGLGGGFRRAEPVGENRVRVTLEGVSFDRLATWLALLEERYRVRAEELSVDEAGMPGVVDARVLLAE